MKKSINEWVDAILCLKYDDTVYHLPCKANIKTHEIKDIEGCDAIKENKYSFWSAEVEIEEKRYTFRPLGEIDEWFQSLDDYRVNLVEELLEIQKNGNYWEASFDGEHYRNLDQSIRFYRWMDLKDCIYEKGREAIADFIGAKPGSDIYAKVMNQNVNEDEFDKQMNDAEAKMSEEEFMQFFDKYYDHDMLY